jgi:hypothetical protein
MQNEIMSLRQVAEKAVALVKFWEGAKTSGVTSLPLRDALILACSSLHNVKEHAPPLAGASVETGGEG